MLLQKYAFSFNPPNKTPKTSAVDAPQLILYLTERYFISEYTLFYIRLSGSR
jgi:hypothetical protein